MDKGKRIMEEEEEYEEPIQIEENKNPNDHTVTFCLLGKLWTDRSYNTVALIETMKKLWSPTKGVECRELGHNLISFQFNTKRDMDRVLEKEPWHFNKYVLVLKPLKADIQPSMIEFNKTPFWIRIYDLPMMGRTENAVRQIASRFGDVMEVDQNTIGGLTRSIRLKITLDLKKPIRRGTKARVGTADPCWIPVTYERLPTFCYYCGMLGHNHKDCEKLQEKEEKEGTISNDQLPFGDWMRASPMKPTQNLAERFSAGRVAPKKTLFAQETEKIQKTEREANLSEGKRTEGQDTDTQISGLLHSLEKVEVSNKKVLNTHTSPSTLPHKTTSTQPKTYPINQQLPNTSTTQNKPATSEPPLPYTPLATLIELLKPQLQFSTSNKPPENKKIETETRHLPALKPSTTIIKPKTSLNDTKNPPNPLNSQTHHHTTHKPHEPLNSTTKNPQCLKHDIKPKTASPVKAPIHNNPNPRSWKRKDGNKVRVADQSIIQTGKRKVDPMDLDEVNRGDTKKVKSTTSEQILKTVEAATQPRRSS